MTLLIVAGLATYTQRAPVQPPFSAVLGHGLVLTLAVLVGVDLVAGKVPRLRRVIAGAGIPAALVAGAVLCTALPNSLLAAGGWAALAGGLVGLAARLALRRAGRWLNARLMRLGHVLAGIVANVLVGIVTAAVFALNS
jgi:hypothetical protein